MSTRSLSRPRSRSRAAMPRSRNGIARSRRDQAPPSTPSAERASPRCGRIQQSGASFCPAAPATWITSVGRRLPSPG
eukprot:186445-Alexandrium_andersonii.AAC.1